MAIAERTGALLATSICGHGLFAGNPWSVGISGGFASPAADELISESDLILAFGASLTHWTTKRGKLIAPGRRRGANRRRGGQARLSDAGSARRPGRRPGSRAGDPGRARQARDRPSGGPAQCRDAQAHRGWRQPQCALSGHVDSARFIDPRTLSKAVDALLPKERAVASNSGHFCGWVPRFLRVPNARASCLSHSFQSVGLGLASAIGLAIANPGLLTVLGAGDGGFLMSLADLETAMRLEVAHVHPDLQRQLLCRRGAPLPPARLFRRYRAVSGHRLRRHRARSWRQGRHRQDACRSRAGAGLGARGRARRVRDRCQDRSRPGGRLARRALSRDCDAISCKGQMRARATCGMLGDKSNKGRYACKDAFSCAFVGGLVAAAAPSGEARAQALPGWNIADICAKESAPGQCAAFEGRALKAVSASWPFVLDPIKQTCLAQVKSPLDQSWRLLSECIDGETIKALDKGAVQTARTPAEPVPPPKPPAAPAVLRSRGACAPPTRHRLPRQPPPPAAGGTATAGSDAADGTPSSNSQRIAPVQSTRQVGHRERDKVEQVEVVNAQLRTGPICFSPSVIVDSYWAENQLEREREETWLRSRRRRPPSGPRRRPPPSARAAHAASRRARLAQRASRRHGAGLPDDHGSSQEASTASAGRPSKTEARPKRFMANSCHLAVHRT